MDGNGHSKMKDFRCHNCRETAARTDGDAIYIDGKIVPGRPISLAFNCKRCRAVVKWRTTRDRKELQNTAT